MTDMTLPAEATSCTFDQHFQDQSYRIAQEVITKTLDGKVYAHGKVSEWTDRITESCISRLRQTSQGLKFCVQCLICQQLPGQGNGGLHSELALRFDPSSDGACVLQWQNNTITCCLTIFGIAM